VRILQSLALAAVLIPFLMPFAGFPADIFNKILEENYDEIRGWFRRLRIVTLRVPPLGQFAGFAVIAALLTALVDVDLVTSR
jgi:hypothetical protein